MKKLEPSRMIWYLSTMLLVGRYFVLLTTFPGILGIYIFFRWLRYVIFVAREAPKAEYEAYLNTF